MRSHLASTATARTAPHPETAAPRPWTRFIIIPVVAVLAFYLWTEHRAHLYGALPYLFLLSCPLMHLFMHHGSGHGGHSDHGEYGTHSGGNDEVSDGAEEASGKER